MGGIELNLDIYKNVQMMWQRMDGGYGGNVKRTDHRTATATGSIVSSAPELIVVR